MFDEKIAKKILQTCLKTGGDFSEIYIENSIYNSISCDNEIIDKIDNCYSSGIGIRILKENESVYGYTNNFNKKNLFILARKLASRFNEKQKNNCQDLKIKKIENISKIEKSYFNVPIEKKISFLKKNMQKNKK